MTRRTERAGHLAELRIANRSIGRSEARRVGEIKEFAANLEFHALANHERLAEREIGIVDTVTAEIGEVTWRVSRNFIAGTAEA